MSEYLIDSNGKRAAISAGYSAKTAEAQASRLLRNVKVAEALKVKNERVAARAEVTKEKVLAGLMKEAENAEAPSARVAAWSWLGRSLAMFTDNQRVEIEAPDRIEIVRRGG